MKILLVQPPSDFHRQAYGINQKVTFGHQPPLGLGYLAAYLEQDGHEVLIQDASARGMTIEESIAEAIAFGPAFIGITTLTNYAEGVSVYATELKKVLPEVSVLVGGAHAIYFYETILDDMPAVDHVIYGEADTVINDYARWLHEPDKLYAVKGLVYRAFGGKVVVNEPPEIVKNLDQVPMPAYHLFDFSLYRPLPMQSQREPFFTMITSRGCWWGRCKFCFQAGRKAQRYRRQSPERTVAELEVLYREFGVREINFWDDAFVVNTKWMKRFRDLIKEKGIDVTFSASARIDSMNEEVLQAAQDAGCWNLFVGVESGNQELLDAIDKGTTMEQARRIFALTNRMGLQTRASFILGLPGETPEMGENTAAFARELEPTFAIFYGAHPRLGTQLYDIAQTQGMFLDKGFHGMSKVTYVPDEYDGAQQLEETISRAYRGFYLRPSYFWRMIKLIKSWKTIKDLAQGVVLFMGLSRSRKL